ncbi:MAG: glycosyltransferase, partial [Chloroflexia bacterium]|nr:glycosyltransferase [Chloroflexia bacterium]
MPQPIPQHRSTPGIMSRLRNVIVINDHAHINGGQAKVAIESAKGLAGAGLEVTFFAACGPVDDSLQAAGVRVECLGQHDILSEPNRLTAATRGLWNRGAANALSRLLGHFDPASSILHCHGFAKALSPAIGPVVTGGPLAHVYTMHEYFLACPNGGFYDYQANAICRRKPLHAACLTTHCDVRRRSHKAWRVARQAVLWSLGAMPGALRDVIYISETQKRVMAPYLGPKTRLHYVPNPVAVGQHPRVQVEHNDTVLFVGRLSPEKGGLLFARAAKQAGVKAVLVGDGPEREAIAAANPDALITGWLTPDEVDDWLMRARCLVFPSLWYETFGLVVFEALALGIPVICGIWNAAAEAVEDGVTGLIVSDRSLSAWS